MLKSLKMEKFMKTWVIIEILVISFLVEFSIALLQKEETDTEKSDSQSAKLLQEQSFGTIGGKSLEEYFAQVPNETVKFYLYEDRSNSSNFKEIKASDADSIKSIKVEEGSMLKILIHGFTSNQTHSFPKHVKDAYLQHTKHTVLIVDWGNMAGHTGDLFMSLLYYPEIADKHVNSVGIYVGNFILTLVNNDVISLDRVHLIGHSLGAHLSGKSGETVEEMNGGKIGRISGLDPAGWGYKKKSLEERLDKEDGKFVDIYHTSYILGDRRATGHVDFFPNSENNVQPDCVKNQNETNGIWSEIYEAFTSATRGEICGHQRAVEYYVKSISDRNMIGCKFQEEYNSKPDTDAKKCSEVCDQGMVYGEHLSNTVEGKYCLKITL